jgi:cell division protease FtsH
VGDENKGVSKEGRLAERTRIHEFQSRPRADELPTRKKLSFWDRIKYLLLFIGLWLVMVWYTYAQFRPIMPWNDAVLTAFREHGWLLALAGVEFLRQVHFFISERWERYHKFWKDKVFGGFERRSGRMTPWNRFRIARALKWLFLIVVVDLVVAQVIGASPALALFQIPVLIVRQLPVLFQLVFGFFFIMLQFIGLFWFLSKGGIDVYYPDDVRARFSDVRGQDAVLSRVMENIMFLEKPEAVEDKGGKVPGGILLYGPPGTGKTLMASAVAGETERPFAYVDAGALNSMFFGVGILKVKSLFRKLRKLALRYGGVIVFFDEADSLGNRGVAAGGNLGGQAAFRDHFSELPSCNGLSYVSTDTASMLLGARLQPGQGDLSPGGPYRMFFGGMGGGGGMGTLNALLTELDGLKKPRGLFNRIVRRALGMRPKPPPRYRILTIMATNMPQALDPALLRPGRLDRMYRVGYPSKQGRLDTYRFYLEKVGHDLTEEELDKVSTITPYATGAVIEDMVNEALINAIQEGREKVTWPDMVKARLFKRLGPGEDIEYIERERHAVAVHEACHAVAAYRKLRHMTIDIATIEKGQTYLGFVAPIPIEEQFTSWRKEYESDLIVNLASLAGERIFYEGENSSGVSGDLQSATQIATFMEAYWGMGSTIGSHMVTKAGVGKPVQGNMEDGTDRNLLETELGRRVERRLEELLDEATALINENRREVLAVAHALETNKTVTGEDIAAIIEGHQGPLINGHEYHTKDFEELAESYHAQALEAHKQHASVLIALPVLPGKRREPEEAAARVGHSDNTKQ